MQQSHALVTFSKDTVLMGVSFNFTAVHEDNTVAENAVSAGIKEVVRIEALISSWDINSQTSQINQQAGIAPVKVDEELFFLIKRAKKVSELTNGLFDISFASIDKVWDFENFDQNRIPDESVLKASIKYIDYKKIILNETDRSVFLAEPGMKIGFGAIGKGYAANKVKQLLLDLEIENGVVNAGGDLLCWGKKANNKEWSIGIADPKDKNKVLSWINTSDMAVVTSGNYEKYFTINGEKYCHIINPTTGWPVKHLASVTIVVLKN